MDSLREGVKEEAAEAVREAGLVTMDILVDPFREVFLAFCLETLASGLHVRESWWGLCLDVERFTVYDNYTGR